MLYINISKGLLRLKNHIILNTWVTVHQSIPVLTNNKQAQLHFKICLLFLKIKLIILLICSTGKRLGNFEVIAGFTVNPVGSRCFLHEGDVPQGGTAKITCDQPAVGRYVFIRKVDPVAEPPNRMLTLCEVQVFGSGTFLSSIFN